MNSSLHRDRAIMHKSPKHTYPSISCEAERTLSLETHSDTSQKRLRANTRNTLWLKYALEETHAATFNTITIIAITI